MELKAIRAAVNDPNTPNALRLDVGRGGLTLTRIADWSRALEQAEDAVVIVIESSAPTFCEGLDLEKITRDREMIDAALSAFGALLDRLERDPRPVIALVDGAARGGGVGLAAASDLVLATDRASFGLPETLIGLIPAVVFPFIARRVGVARARWLALSGTPLEAARAAEWGMVDEITDDPPRALARTLTRLGRLDGRAIASIKHLSASHFAASSSYRPEALDAFSALLASTTTRRRIQRLREGFSPWDDDDHE